MGAGPVISGVRAGRIISAALLGLGLTACMDGEDFASRSDLSLVAQEGAVPAAPALDPDMEDGTTSAIIEALLLRHSVLEPGPMRDVAEAVMAANTRAAEAELRAATLRAEAEQYNWLPTIGPSISLTSLGSVVASLVLNQAIIDHGARRAEREYAKHDVEVAAVALAQDSNARVLDALDLYITAQAAQARAEVGRAAAARMDHYTYVMTERVNAGISDRADLQVITQKQDQMRSDLAADMEAATTALRELQAMAATPVAEISGLSGIAPRSLTAEALSVMKSRAEADRAVAAARVTRAGFLPGLSLGGSVGTEGTDYALNAGVPGGAGLGLGTGAAMRAVEAEAEAAAAVVGAEREAAEREIAALEGELDSLRRRHGEAVSLARQAADNYALFDEQQRAGQRAVSEVVSVFQTKVSAERRAVTLEYDVVLAELRVAERLGLLVDGERM